MLVNRIKICPDLHKLHSHPICIRIRSKFASDLYLIYKLSPSARVCISDTDRLRMFYLVLKMFSLNDEALRIAYSYSEIIKTSCYSYNASIALLKHITKE